MTDSNSDQDSSELANSNPSSTDAESTSTEYSQPSPGHVNLRLTYLVTGNPKPPHSLGSVALSTTITALKEKIQETLPEHPAPTSQRLIYQGRPLLRNEDTLNTALRIQPNTVITPLPFTIHIVVQSSTQLPPVPQSLPTLVPTTTSVISPSPPLTHESAQLTVNPAASNRDHNNLQNELTRIQQSIESNRADLRSVQQRIAGQQQQQQHQHQQQQPQQFSYSPRHQAVVNMQYHRAQHDLLHANAIANQLAQHPQQGHQQPPLTSLPLPTSQVNGIPPNVPPSRPTSQPPRQQVGRGLPTLPFAPQPGAHFSLQDPAGPNRPITPSMQFVPSPVTRERPTVLPDPPAMPVFPPPPPLPNLPHFLTNPPFPLLPQQATSTNSSANTRVWILSSPAGPQALLFSSAHGYYTSSNPQLSSLGQLNHPLVPTPRPQPGTTNNAGLDAQPQDRRNPQVPILQQDQPQINPVQPQLQPRAQPVEPEDLFALLIQRVWLFLRLYLFMYVFSEPGSWQRYTMMVLATIVCLQPRNGPLTRILRAVRQHMDNLIGPPRPPGQIHGVGRPARHDHGHQGPLGAGEAAQRPVNVRGAVQMTPEEAAARLIAEHQERNPSFWRGTLHRIEQSAVLFLASLIPGVGERHVQAREDVRRRVQRLEERLRAEMESAQAQAQAMALVQVAEQSDGVDTGEANHSQDQVTNSDPPPDDQDGHSEDQNRHNSGQFGSSSGVQVRDVATAGGDLRNRTE